MIDFKHRTRIRQQGDETVLETVLAGISLIVVIGALFMVLVLISVPNTPMN